MIIENKSEQVYENELDGFSLRDFTFNERGYGMEYNDDPIFEDFNIVRPLLKPSLFNIHRPANSYNIQLPTTSYHIQPNTGFNIVSSEPQSSDYNIVRAPASYNTVQETPDGTKNIKYNIVAAEEESKSTWFKKLLKTFSHYGMNYDDDVLRNMYAIPADKDLVPKTDIGPADIYTQMMKWKQKSNENQSFFEKDLNSRREVLRKLAQLPELEDILDVMCNECIVYDSDISYICEPFIDTNIIETLTKEATYNIKDQLDKAFYRFYMLLDWKTKAWDEFKRFLIDGVLAYEIIYDSIEHPHQILGFVPVDPATLTKAVEEGITFWYQYKGVNGKERKMLDAQIIYIKYQDSGVVTRQSYLERLIRPFNIYRIIEQAQIIWTVTQASFKTVFTIPIGNLGKARGRQTINSAMAMYREDISFDGESGELKVNGKVNQPFNKEYWLPENENGKPQIETLVDNGPDLNDSTQLKYFKNELYKMSKIPASRFDKDNAATWFGTDASAVLRDEINFSRFVTRIRNTFALIMLKPLQIQLAMAIPELKGDKRILTAISLRFNSYNQFEELMNIEVMQKRLDFVQTMKDSLVDTDADGNEHKFFSSRFLAEKYLKMSNADLLLNEKYRKDEEVDMKPEPEEVDDELSDNVTRSDEPQLGPPAQETEEVGSDEFGGGNADAGSGPSDAEQAQSDFDQPI